MIKGYTYDSFGGASSDGNGSFNNEVQFTGAIADSHGMGNGVYYMNARYYNPNTGRFLTQDSYSGNAWEPWTQHLYTYCGNNPVNFVDPTGHFPLLLITAFIGAAVGAGAVFVADLLDDGQINTDAKVYLGAAAGGAIVGLTGGIAAGAVASGAVGLGTGMVGAGLGGAAGSIVNQQIATGSVDPLQAGIDGVVTGLSFGVFYGISMRMGQYFASKPSSAGTGTATKGTSSTGKAPQKAYDVADDVLRNNGAPPNGYKGGRVFQNDVRAGGQKLPDGVIYKEYDINPYIKGQNRGPERIVIGDDGLFGILVIIIIPLPG